MWELDIESSRMLNTEDEDRAWIEKGLPWKPVEEETSKKSRRLLVIESRMPKLMIWENASPIMVLAKWCDYQSSGLGGLELVVQKYTDQ